MKAPIMRKKRLLGIDGELNFLLNLENEILCACPQCRFDTATSFEDARELILLITYDLAILDIIRAPGAKLVHLIASRNFPVLAISDRRIFPDELNYCDGLKFCGFHPKIKLHQSVPIINNVLGFVYTPRWRRTLNKFCKKTGWAVSEVLMVQNSLDKRFPAKSEFYYYLN